MTNKISDECIAKLHNFYANNEDAMDNDLEVLDERTLGILGKKFMRPMERFDNTMKGTSPSKIADLVRTGHDVKVTACNGHCAVFSDIGFNVKRHYFFFDDDNNLTSTDTRNCDFFLNNQNLLYIVRLARGGDEGFCNSLSDGAMEIIRNYI